MENRDATTTKFPWIAAAAAAFTPTVVFVCVPNNITLRNFSDLPYSAALALTSLGCLLTTWLFTIGVLIVASRTRLFGHLLRLLVLPGLCILLFDVVGALTAPFVRGLWLAILIDVAAVMLAFEFLRRLRPHFLSTVFAVISVVLLVQGLTTHFHLLWRHERDLAVRATQASHRLSETLPPSAAPFDGNLYHIILDGFQSEAYRVLAGQDSLWRFDGFTYYPEFRAGYFVTEYSLPHLLNGRPYDPEEPLLDWIDAAVPRGLWMDLASAGAEISLYPVYTDLCAPYARSCNASQSTTQEQPGSSPERVWIDLWFSGLLPHSLRVVLTRGVTMTIPGPAPGAGVVRDVSSQDVFSLTNALFPPGKSVVAHPIHRIMTNAVVNFRRTIAEEVSRPRSGQYVFAHVFLPHFPYVLDAKCRYVGADAVPAFGDPANVVTAASLDQARCALRLIREFVDQLKNLNRYEDSLIVVHADHGMDPQDAPAFVALYPDAVRREWGKDDDNLEGYARSAIVGMRSHALLLVKFPRSRGFSESSDAVDMTDLAPTFLDALGLPRNAYPGVPIQSRPPNLARERVFFAGFPSRDFFRLGKTNRKLVLPEGGLFRRFVLDGGRWKHHGDVPVH